MYRFRLLTGVESVEDVGAHTLGGFLISVSSISIVALSPLSAVDLWMLHLSCCIFPCTSFWRLSLGLHDHFTVIRFVLCLYRVIVWLMHEFIAGGSGHVVALSPSTDLLER